MIQLSLFPARGFGLVGVPGIVEDWRSGEPFFVKTIKTARRYAKELAWGYARVVRLERHEAVEGANSLPTYVISELKCPTNVKRSEP
jgi:hypothetical protein